MAAGDDRFENAVRAAVRGDLEALRNLPESVFISERTAKGVRVDEIPREGEFLIHRVLRQGAPLSVIEFIAHDRHDRLADMRTRFGGTPLLVAAACGRLDAVRLFVEVCHMDPRTDRDGDLFTPLHCACQNGHVEVAHYLVSTCGCDAHVQDAEGVTTLFIACQHGQVEAVRYLLDLGVDASRRNLTGVSPLSAAAQEGHLACVSLLLESAHCDPNVPDDEGSTAMLAACFAGHTAVVKRLAAAGADFALRNEQGVSPLFAAAFNNHTETVEFLLSGQCRGVDARTESDRDEFPPATLALVERAIASAGLA